VLLAARAGESLLTDGALFAGRYRVVRALAKGGMGCVYEVVHLETERPRALKLMHPHTLDSPELRDRFRREARVTSRVESEFIVEVFDAGIDEVTSQPFLVMELLRGEELSKRIKRAGALSRGEVVSHLGQVAMALDKTHAANIVHRDLKPENLFLTVRDDGSPRVKILDFGVAKLVAESETQGATRSLGTPLYMAPEQFHGGGRVTPAADIYALGLIGYTLLTGKPYWLEENKRAENVFQFAALAMQGPQEPASQRAARHGVPLPVAIDAWFAKATATEPTARFARASDAVAALAGALGVPFEASGLVSTPPPTLEPTRPNEGEAKTVAIVELDDAALLSAAHHGASGNGTSAATATNVAVSQRLERPARSLAPLLALGAAGLVAAGAIAFALSRRAAEPTPMSQTPATTVAAPRSSAAPPAAEAPAPASAVSSTAPPASAATPRASASTTAARAAAPPSPARFPRSTPTAPPSAARSKSSVPLYGRD
jgi:serine/threonine-protein kinase